MWNVSHLVMFIVMLVRTCSSFQQEPSHFCSLPLGDEYLHGAVLLTLKGKIGSDADSVYKDLQILFKNKGS